MRRSGLSTATHGNGHDGHDAGALHAALPDTLEYWADGDRAAPTPFRYLTALRQSPPGVKSFG